MRETDNEGSYPERSEASVLAPGFFCIAGSERDGWRTYRDARTIAVDYS